MANMPNPLQLVQQQLLEAEAKARADAQAAAAHSDAQLMAQGSAAVLAAWQTAAAANADPRRISQLKQMYAFVLRKEQLAAPLPTDSTSLLKMLQDAQLAGDTQMADRAKKALDVAKVVEDKQALDASKDLASRPLPTDVASLQKLLTQAKDQNRTADAARLQAALADAMTRDAAAKAIGVSSMPPSTNAGADPLWQRFATVAALTAPFWLTALLTRGNR